MVPSINTIPPEILAQIFYLLVTDEFCNGIRNYKRPKLLTGENDLSIYPYILLEVCKAWQQLAVATPVLWSRIVLVNNGPRRNRSYERASRSIELTANVLLSIRITGSEKHPQPSHLVEQLTEWLAPIVNRICSLDVNENAPHQKLLERVLLCWLQHGSPSSVKRLVLSRDVRLKLSAALEPPSPHKDLAISFESLFQQTTFLKFNGAYIYPWTSQVYRGLIDLHLTHVGNDITEAQFLDILRANPQLSSLTWDGGFKDRQPHESFPEPVYLPQLTRLNLADILIPNLWLVLRLITPGPLQLTLVLNFSHYRSHWHFMYQKDVSAFFNRSNVAVCHFGSARTGGTRPVWSVATAMICPNLHTIRLQGLNIRSSLSPEAPVCQGAQTYSHLSIMECSFHLEHLKRMLIDHPIKVLRIWNCTVFLDNQSEERDAGRLERLLVAIIPNTRCYGCEAGHDDPYLSWDYARY